MQQVIARNEAEICGKVPLHQTNLIQPHGYLLVVHRATWKIVQISENAEVLFGMPASVIVQTSLHEYLSAQQIKELQNRAEEVNARLPFVFSFGDSNYLGTIKMQEDFYIIELESKPRQATGDDSFLMIYQDMKYVMAAIEKAGTLDEACRLVAQEIKRISGFDKVMVYRFDDHWNGDVVAEEMEQGMDSYLGLKFPASDVPKQARDLYQKTAYRLIPDIQYQPVRLFPVINPVTNSFTNLSDSNLRSVAAVHLEYLRNMKVNASMSVRILYDDRLWGLIACHHRTPRFLSFEVCSALEILSYVISSKITSLLNETSYHFHRQKQELQARIIQEVYQQNDVKKGLQHSKDALLELLNSDGVAIISNGTIETKGKVPERDDIEDLVLWLQTQEHGTLYQQPNLSSVYEPAVTYATEASGLLALTIQQDKGTYILAFRPEEIEEVAWGGNPSEAVHFENDGIRYHPRASFDIWKQAVRQTAIPWNNDERLVAEQLRNFIVDFTLRKT